MNNINTQVNLRNGVDFSKIRKVNRISKFSIGGITHVGGDWYNTIFSSFRLAMMNELAAAKTPEEKERIVEKYNSLQSAYGKLRPQFTNLSSVNYNKSVEDYQNLINNDFRFVNSFGIKNGVATNRYKKIGTANRIGKDLADKWTADGYWAGLTQDRTTLGYKGDWDEESDLFKTWQKSLNDIGMETFLDSDNTYKLRLLPPTPPITPPITPPVTPPPPEEEPEIPGDYTPDEYPVPFKFRPQPFTSPITNGIIAGLGLAANRHAYDNEMNKKVPLLEAPYHQYITGAYKGTIDAYNRVGTNIRSQANRIASQSANLEQNQATQLQGAEMAANKELEGALKQQEGYNQDRIRALETANGNIDSGVSIANQNRVNLVADWNRRKDARSKYQLQRNAILVDNVMKNRTDYGQWKANEENERDAALSSYNQYIANLRDLLIKKPYQDLLADASTSNAFNQVYQNAIRDWESKRETSWATNPENRDFTNIWTGSNDDATRRSSFLTYLQTHGDSEYGKQFSLGYNEELVGAKNKYIQDAQSLQNELMALNPTFRNTYTTEGFYNPNRLGKQLRFVKEGGILKMKTGSRFVDYLEHNRKALKDQKLTTLENAKQALKVLQKQLEAIDRETLILLRSIFK